jgi:hypothetical protein
LGTRGPSLAGTLPAAAARLAVLSILARRPTTPVLRALRALTSALTLSPGLILRSLTRVRRVTGTRVLISGNFKVAEHPNRGIFLGRLLATIQ